jgi:ethanolamine ammonia-lyase large subunit
VLSDIVKQHRARERTRIDVGFQSLAGTSSAPAYVMAVAGNADPMLGYLTTSFREHPRLRRYHERQISSAMQDRLVALGTSASEGDRGGSGSPALTAHLFAAYMKASGDRRTSRPGTP